MTGLQTRAANGAGRAGWPEPAPSGGKESPGQSAGRGVPPGGQELPLNGPAGGQEGAAIGSDL